MSVVAKRMFLREYGCTSIISHWFSVINKSIIKYVSSQASSYQNFDKWKYQT